ncbi:hypothetical protein ACMATS_06035 [Streptoverticillium reticulum]|uniref:hypothetical protein n=1 Tax=Streptoverticillium reticulum TaxID=1433415 RepID=UPI0039BED9BF
MRAWREPTEDEKRIAGARPRSREGWALVCDLCTLTKPMVWWPVHEFAVQIPDKPGRTVYLSGERLATCRLCKRDIEKNLWDRITRRRPGGFLLHQAMLTEGYRERIVKSASPVRVADWP